MVGKNKFKFDTNNKILLIALFIEFFGIISTMFAGGFSVPFSNVKLATIIIFLILTFATIIWGYWTNKEFYQHHNKKFAIIITLLIMLIPMFFTGYIRSYAYELPVTNDWAENMILGNLQSQISQEISREYPNLPPQTLQKEIDKEINRIISENYEDYTNQISALSQNFKSKFQGENNQTYFLAIDPYYYDANSKLYYTNGYIGDKLTEEGLPLMSRRLAPDGIENMGMDFHTWIESKLFSWNNLGEDALPEERMKAVYFLPVLFAILSIIPLFLIIRSYSSNLYAFIGSLFFSIVSVFLSRTMAGFVDTDAYNVFFPMVILGFIIWSISAKQKWTTALLAGIAGLFQVFFLFAWPNGWFAYLFINMALIGYIGYTFLAELVERKKLKLIVQRLNIEIIALVSFVGTSFLFSLIRGENIISQTINSVIGMSGGIALATVGNIWPNVLSSVAELNPASFATIIESVGGALIFLISLLGILLLSLDFENKKDKYTLYKRILVFASLVWYSVFVFTFSKIGFLNSLHNYLLSLTSNSSILFVILLFLPVFIGLAFSLHNTNSDKKTFLAILLSVWFAATIYMSFNGMRFILLLAPAFGIAAGVGLYYIARFVNNLVVKIFDFELNFFTQRIGMIFVLIVFLISFYPNLTSAHQMAYHGTTPNFDDNWFDLMYKINENSSENAIITSWWDFGHFFVSIAERGVLFDGASQTHPASHWVGKLLMETDEKKSVDILRMLVCSSNGAFDLMLEKSNDVTGGVLVNKIIYETLGKSREDKIQILKENEYFKFSDEDVSQIIEKLHCENPPENYLITSQDMISKAGVWAHWGSWDFTRKYVLDNYKNLSPQEMAQNSHESLDEIQILVDELNNIDLKVKYQNVKKTDIINQWLAPYPAYAPINGQYWLPCQKQNTTLNCQNAVVVDLNTFKANFLQPDSPGINTLFVFNKDTTQQLVVKHSSEGAFDVVLIKEDNEYAIMLAQNPLGGSLFTKLFFLNGMGTTLFEPFDTTTSVVGWKISTWIPQWD